MKPAVEIGYAVFLSDRGDAFGAVRKVGVGGRPDLVVHVEGSGEHVIRYEAIEKVVAKKVVVHRALLEARVQRAIAHVLDREEIPPPAEVELVPPPPDEDDAQDDSWAPAWQPPRRASPPGELPGRDVGSRYGAPPSVAGQKSR